MAIQIPNPGTGNGATGDNEFVLWSKVKDNFSDQTNAASRLVGEAAGNVMQVGAFGLGAKTGGVLMPSEDVDNPTVNKYGSGFYSSSSSSTTQPLSGIINVTYNQTYPSWQLALQRNYKDLKFRYAIGEVYKSASIYHTDNTLKDANGFIKAASPTVQVFADKVELNGEAEDQDVSYKKNGIGDYTITTVSGLSTDGWYIELPKDMNGNPKVAVTLSEVGGVISLKSYKRIFSMETFTFEPDLDSPLDIPDTRWIDLRLNEIPVEYDIQPEEVDLDK